MPDMAQTASAATSLHGTGSDIHTSEAFVNALAKGLDKVWMRDFTRAEQGRKYMREESMSDETMSYRTFRSLSGQVPVSRDADDIPFITRGEGFGFTVQSYIHRQGIAIEKTMAEVDRIGAVRGLQRDLAKNSDLTIEKCIADVFNRAVNPSSAPVLCDDGMYLIDSGRPNANPMAASWSNEESASAITSTSIFTAQLNARGTTDESGEIAPQMIKKIICRPTDEKTLWEIANSDKRPTDASNAANFQYGKFEYEVYDFLTDAAIFYLMGDVKSEDNELFLFWRVKPEFKTWVDGSNPDITRQRVRMAFGIAAGSPKKVWRGGEVS